jgi:thymidine phosphorylase
MNEPLGRSIGTGIEVIEARDFLRGTTTDDRFREQCMHVATAMLELGGFGHSREAGAMSLESGAAYAKFMEMIAAQGGSVEALEAMRLPDRVDVLRAPQGGFVQSIDGVFLGYAAREWSMREATAGIRISVRAGERVAKGDALAECYGAKAEAASIQNAFIIGSDAPHPRPLVYASI